MEGSTQSTLQDLPAEVKDSTGLNCLSSRGAFSPFPVLDIILYDKNPRGELKVDATGIKGRKDIVIYLTDISRVILANRQFI
jgi:hypothetical protein